MRKRTYIKKMIQHEERLDKLWQKMVADTNKFIEKNPKQTMYSLNRVEIISEDLCLKGAWIQDRINGKYPRDRGSLTKKIRRVLGFTYP